MGKKSEIKKIKSLRNEPSSNNQRYENITPDDLTKERSSRIKKEKKSYANNNDLIYSKELIKEKKRKKNLISKDYGNMEKIDNSQVDFHEALELLEQANQSKNQI